MFHRRSGTTHLNLPEPVRGVRFIVETLEALAIKLPQALSIKLHLRDELRVAKDILQVVPQVTAAEVMLDNLLLVWNRDDMVCELIQDVNNKATIKIYMY